MTLDELIEQLEDVREELGTGEGVVYVASQPSWPLTNVIDNVVSNAQVVDQSEDPTLGADSADVWIAVSQVESRNVSPYAPSGAWE